jgi:putative intracellular protease/amidase
MTPALASIKVKSCFGTLTVHTSVTTSSAIARVFYPGGHGPMWDLAEDPNSVMLIESFLAAGKPIALVCHAPGVLRHVKTPSGKPLVEGKKVTGFTNGEEADVGLTKVVPFLVEDEPTSPRRNLRVTGKSWSGKRRLGVPRCRLE